MPVVAVDARGGGPQASLLVAELRRFEGLRVPAWRPWSRLVAPHAVHALGGRLPRALPCPGIVAYTRMTDERTLRDARLVLCPSQAAMRGAARRPGADEARLRVVPHGVALPPRRQLRPPDTGRTGALALGGEMQPLRDAWRRAGGGGELARPDRADAAAALAGTSVLVDLRDDVLFGGLALLALAAGVPVVALAGGAAAEAIGDAGVLVEDRHDPEAVAQALGCALRDRESLAAAGPPRAALFTWSGTAEATVMTYRELW